MPRTKTGVLVVTMIKFEAASEEGGSPKAVSNRFLVRTLKPKHRIEAESGVFLSFSLFGTYL